MDSMQRFLSKLFELIRGKVKDADLTAAEFNAAVKAAAGHVGGTMRWEKVREERETGELKGFPYSRLDQLPEGVRSTLPEDAQKVWMAAFNTVVKANPDDEGRAAAIAWGAIKRAGWKQGDNGWVKAGEMAPEAVIAALEVSEMNPFRLLGEVSLAEDGSKVEVQIFPAVGKYSHPRYGELDISKSFLREVKQNFDAKIYQQELPLSIDLEHQTALSGAAGWIESVEIRGDKGMWATIPLNDRGKELCSKDAFRYFSPEFYDTWKDPATNKQYSNLLIGGALTNRPFFKGMQAVAMMSEGTFVFAEPVQADEDMMSKMDDMMGMMQSMMGMMSKMEMPASEKAAITGMMDKIKDNMAKMKKQMPAEAAERPMKTEDGQSYPAEAFVYTPDKAKPSTWKLRVWESPEAKVTRAQLGRAVAALDKGFRGQTVDMPDADKAAARSKIKAMYAQMGVKPEDMPAMMASLCEAGLSEVEARTALVDLGLAEQPTGGESVGMTEDEARQLKEMGDSLKTLGERLAAAEAKAMSEETARKTAEDQAKQAAERVAALERDANRKLLSEFVRTNRLSFQETEVEQSVDKLEKLQAKLGEDFQLYLDDKHGLHERIKGSPMFEQLSRPAMGSGAAGEMDAAKRKIMSENPQMSEAEASVKAASENPALYNRYDTEFKRTIKRGGE